MTAHDQHRRKRALIEIALGVVFLLGGIALAAYLMSFTAFAFYIFEYTPIFIGIVLICAGIIRLLPQQQAKAADHRAATPAARRRSSLQIVAGLAGILAGMIGAWLVYDPADPLVANIVAYVPVALGGVALVWGLVHFLPLEAAHRVALEYVPKIGYRSFVAWRYLLDRHHRVTLRTKVTCAILILLRIVLWKGLGVGARFAGFQHPLHVLGLVVLGALVVVIVWGILRFSKLSLFVFFAGLLVAAMCVGLAFIVALGAAGKLPFADEPLISPDTARRMLMVLGFVMLGGLGLSALAMFFGTLRGFFTFFTTVPIGGVWIGTAALVLVLAVMSGFESDLRDKILGSNAHIQVTKEDGEFTDWREAKKKIDAIPGVVASTPYAVSEVVIAANNNGMNVIIKGIDPDTVAHVTDLVDDLRTYCPSTGLSMSASSQRDPDAMKRLQPLIDVKRDRSVPQRQRPAVVVDPPPDDMVTGGDPMDFSGGGSAVPDDAGVPEPDAGAAAPDAANRAGDPDIEPATPYGGDANTIVLSGGNDWLPDSQLLRWFVGADNEHRLRVTRSGDAVIVSDLDLPIDPNLSRRTQALPGILVGCELVKQTHLYTGEEVRVVSPLSDPSNPDATGTPIPFNRDYRVAGVFYTGMYEYDLKFVYVSLDSLQDFLDLGDTVDGIEVRVGSPDDTDRYVPYDDGVGDHAGLIRKALGPGYRVQDWKELNRSLFSALKLEKIAMFLVLGIVILVASFSIIGNLIMVVVEKQREIALLKTLGASDAGLMQLFAIQGLIIGIIGTTLGVLFGLAGCAALDEFGLPLDPDVYYINRLPIHVDTQSVIAAAITGVLISIAATLYPALMAARVRPADGMRH